MLLRKPALSRSRFVVGGSWHSKDSKVRCATYTTNAHAHANHFVQAHLSDVTLGAMSFLVEGSPRVLSNLLAIKFNPFACSLSFLCTTSISKLLTIGVADRLSPKTL